MSMTDELQRRFDNALASMSPTIPSPPARLHDRLRKRQLKGRVVLVGAAAAIVAMGLSIGLTGAPSQPAGAVVLRVSDDTQVSQRELSADAMVMRNRLALIGDTHAQVSVSGDTIVVTGGPSQLSDPNTPLTQSPALFVRPVLCYSGSYVESSVSSAESLPSSCGAYAIQPATPEDNPGQPPGFSTPHAQPDPALSQFPSTTPSEDLANPGAVALLPGPTPQGSATRYLVGPTELRLSSAVASAQVVQDQYGNWTVKVELGSTSASQWNEVAEKYFHLSLAVDLNGQIVTAPIIEPTQTSFTPFAELVLSGGFSQATAEAVAAALQSGPLPVPIQAT